MFKQRKIRNFIKHIIFRLVTLPYIFRAPRPTILMYHAVGRHHHSLSITPEEFERQMRYLVESGFSFLRSTDLRGNNVNLSKSVLITFDDGLSELYEYAVPVLKKYQIPAVFFIPTGLVGEAYIHPEFHCLNWAQIKNIADDSLFEIGSHTVSHKNLLDLNMEERVFELVQSKKTLEEKLSKQVCSFAAPFGRYDRSTLGLIKDAGYKMAFSTNAGYVSTGMDLLEIPRLGINMFVSNYFPTVFRGGYVLFLKLCKILFN